MREAREQSGLSVGRECVDATDRSSRLGADSSPCAPPVRRGVEISEDKEYKNGRWRW